MAGAGIRYWELANVLSEHADVTLAAGKVGTMPATPVELLEYEPHSPSAIRPPLADADLVVAKPQWPTVAAWLRRARARVVYDLYDPETLETLELFSGRRASVQRLMSSLTLDRLDDALRGGDHFMCASEKQRDLWLGAMLARRIINPVTYGSDPTFRSFIDVVSFGLPDAAPDRPAGDPISRRFPSIQTSHEVVLWNGGIWNWLDPATAVRAFAEVVERRPNTRLVFMGASSQAAAARATREAHEAARVSGLLDRAVFFNDAWVPYGERPAWLARAACAVMAHREHLESRFAFRTRMLDCFWARVPVVCTAGDGLAEVVARRGLGEAVAPHDSGALADALTRVLERGRATYEPALAEVAVDYRWSAVAAPLVGWLNLREQSTGSRGAFTPSPSQIGRSSAYRLTHRLLWMGLRSYLASIARLDAIHDRH